MEKSSIITLMGAGRCTFDKNGECNTHKVMSNSVGSGMDTGGLTRKLQIWYAESGMPDP